MSEPYKCGQCGGSKFRVDTQRPGTVSVRCDGPMSVSCTRKVTASSVTAAFEAISKKDDAKCQS